MNSRPRVVVDIGGTSLRMGRLDAKGAVGPVVRQSTPSVYEGFAPERVLADLVRRLRRMAVALDADEPSAVAVGFPGPISPDGHVLAAPTVWQEDRESLDGVDEALRAAWPGAHVMVMNDVSAAGFAIVESGTPDFMLVTVSSGVGAKLFLGGRPITGSGIGGEIGHVTYSHHDPPIMCECGGTNHLGALASGRGIRSVYSQMHVAHSGRSRFTSPSTYCARTEEVLDASLQGDAIAVAAVEASADAIAHSLVMAHAICGVPVMYLMGGVVDHLGPMYLDCLRRAATRHCSWLGSDWISMVRAHPFDDPGLEGAAAYLRMHGPRTEGES